MLMTSPNRHVVPRNAIGVNLVVFFAFALAALVMLTRTVLSAVQINTNVGDAIKPVIGSVQANTALLPTLQTTVQLTTQIRSASNAVGSDVSGVAAATGHINATLALVYQHVQSIAGSVDGINASVTTIRGAIQDLVPTVGAIRIQSGDIASRYGSVADGVSGLPPDINSTAASLRQIQALIEPIDTAVNGIDLSLKSINGHVVAIADNPAIQLSNLLTLLGK